MSPVFGFLRSSDVRAGVGTRDFKGNGSYALTFNLKWTPKREPRRMKPFVHKIVKKFLKDTERQSNQRIRNPAASGAISPLQVFCVQRVRVIIASGEKVFLAFSRRYNDIMRCLVFDSLAVYVVVLLSILGAL